MKSESFQYFSKDTSYKVSCFLLRDRERKENKFDFAVKVVCVLFFIQTTTTNVRVSKDENHFFTALTWKNGPTMNDNSSIALKTSCLTKVFAF